MCKGLRREGKVTPSFGVKVHYLQPEFCHILMSGLEQVFSLSFYFNILYSKIFGGTQTKFFLFSIFNKFILFRVSHTLASHDSNISILDNNLIDKDSNI